MTRLRMHRYVQVNVRGRAGQAAVLWGRGQPCTGTGTRRPIGHLSQKRKNNLGRQIRRGRDKCETQLDALLAGLIVQREEKRTEVKGRAVSARS